MKSLAANAIPVWASLKEQRVALAEIGKEDLSYPGFDMAVARTTDWWDIDTAGLLDLVTKERPRAPARVHLPHLSLRVDPSCEHARCASLAQGYKRTGVDQPVPAAPADLPDEPRNSALLHALVSSYGRGLSEDHGTVVKFTSWNIAFADYVMHVFSDVGATVLWRAAAPTVSSFVATPPAWAAMRSSPAELRRSSGNTLDDVPSDMEDLAFYATAWLAFANYGSNWPASIQKGSRL